MTLIKSSFKTLLAIGLLVSIFSCNNAEQKEEPPKAADTTTPAAIEPAPAAFKPFDIVEITHTVKDYDKWVPLFETDAANRKASGLNDVVVARNIDNPSKVFIVLDAADVQKAKDFSADPRLKEVMEKGGVNSKPMIEFFHVIRFDPNVNEKKWVTVTHKVKDFDAWVKVFDGEGTAARAAEGLIDAVMARGVDDPNLVQVVFDIKEADFAKAKAAIMSEEKKKLMMSAGVEGKPRIEFYQTTIQDMGK